MPSHRHFPRFETFLSSLVVTAVLSASATLAGSVNVTVDDTYGDTNTGGQIAYGPAGSWNVGQTCTTCTARPNVAQAFDGSWHDATFYPTDSTVGSNLGSLVTASYVFNGSAVYVYCILSQSAESPDGNTDMTFILDGQSVGTLEQLPTGANTYTYNQLVYSNAGLTQGQHNITIATGYNNTKALILLDRIVYTTESEDVTTTIAPISTSDTLSTIHASSQMASSGASASGTSSSRGGTIAGAVIGSLAGVAAFACALFFWYRRRRIQKEEEEAEKAVQPFLHEDSSSGPPTAGSRTTEGSTGLGPPVGSRFSLDSSAVSVGHNGGVNYPFWARGRVRRGQVHGHPDPAPQSSPALSYPTFQQSPGESSGLSGSRSLGGVPLLSTPAPPPKAHHRDRRRTRPRVSTANSPQSPNGSRKTTQKLPMSPLYSPIPGLSPDTSTSSSNFFPDFSRPRNNTNNRSNSRRFKFPVLLSRSTSTPQTTPSPFMPTDLYSNTPRPKPSARNYAGKDLGTYPGTCALGPSLPRPRPVTRSALGVLAENESVSDATAVEGGKNAAILEEHRHRRWRKGGPRAPPNEGLVSGSAQYVESSYTQETLRRMSTEEEGSTIVNVSSTSPAMRARPLPDIAEKSDPRVTKEVAIMPTQPLIQKGHRPLPSRPLPQPHGPTS